MISNRDKLRLTRDATKLVSMIHIIGLLFLWSTAGWADDYVQIRLGLTGDEQVIVEGAGALSEGNSLTVAFR